MTTERDHHTSHTTTNPGIGEVTITIRDRHQSHDKIHLLRILVDNSDQTHLTPRCLTVLGIGTRVTIYEKKFPTSNNCNQPNVVRFTTTDDEIKELSGLCPLNY